MGPWTGPGLDGGVLSLSELVLLSTIYITDLVTVGKSMCFGLVSHARMHACTHARTHAHTHKFLPI